MTWAGLKRALATAYDDVLNHPALQVAAALSYYFILAVLPGLIFLSAVMGSIPLPDLFGRVLDLMSRLLPAPTMDLVRKVLLEVLSSNRKMWLSVGMLGIIWLVSAAFDATIEALDIAYDVKNSRPLWKTRLLAIGLGAICGGLLMAALAIMIVGPRFVAWLDNRIPRLAFICCVVALRALGGRDQFYNPGRRRGLFYCSECEATIPGNLTRSHTGSDLLAWAVVPAGSLFQALCRLQPDVRDVGRLRRIYDMALLEFVCSSGRRQSKHGTGERKWSWADPSEVAAWVR